jgi:hypothetical protein
MMKKRLVLLLAAVVFFYAGDPARANQLSTASGAIEGLRYENGRISLRAHSVPLITLLDEIVAAANIKIISASRIQADQLVEAEVLNKPLEETLRSILQGYNYLVCFYADPSQSGLHLLAGSTLSQGGIRLPSFSGGSAFATVDKPVADHATDNFPANPGGAGKPRYAARGNTPLSANGYKGKSEAPSSPASRKNSASNRSAPQIDAAGTASPDDFNGEWDAEPYENPEENPAALEQASLEKNWKREDYLRGQIKVLTQNLESGYSDRHYNLWVKRKDPKYITHDRERLEHYEKELAKLLENS